VNIGDRVRLARRAAGLSQEEVARRAGIGLNAVNRLERGESSDPHYSTLQGLARALGVPIELLVKEEAPPKAGAPEKEPGQSPDLEQEATVENVITFDQEGVREAIRAHKEGKISKAEVRKAIADLVRGGPTNPLEEAIELLLELTHEHSEDKEGAKT
jgi:transcriptional regulator with XRE-family HTH domain